MRTVALPPLFWEDHSDRFADNPEFKWKEIKRTKHNVTIKMNEAAYNNLRSDADYYSNGKDGPDNIYPSLRRSAIATLKRL